MSTARVRASLLMAAAWLAYFAKQIFSSGVPFRRDALFVHLPARQFIHEQLASGSFPQWYPYEGVGVPFIGQIVTATFHPQTLLFLPLSAPQALKWNTLFAYLFGIIGSYKLARAFGASRVGAWLGGLALAFGGYALSMSDNLPYLVSLCTLPWVGWAAQRLVLRQRGRDVALLGVLWALILLGGDAQMFTLAPAVMLVPLIVHAHRGSFPRQAGLIIVGGVLATALCAVELLPAASLYGSSARAEGQWVIDIGTYWALHPWRLLEFVTPGFLPPGDRARLSKELFGNPFVWSASLFAGGVVIWLSIAGVARRQRVTWCFTGLALFAVWMAMGSRGGFYTVLTKIAPPLALFRFPEKYLALFWVALAPLVALGWDAVRQAPRRWGIVAGVLVALALIGSRLPLPSSAWNDGLLMTALFIGLAGLCLQLPKTQWIIPVLLIAELWRGNSGYLPLVSPELLNEQNNPIAERVKQEPSRGLAPARVLNVGSPKAVASDDPDAQEAWVRASMLLLRPDSAGLAHIGVIGRSALPGYGGRPRELFGPLGVRSAEMAGLMNACFRTEISAAGVTAEPQPCRPRAYFAALRPAANSDAALQELQAGIGEQEAVWESDRALPLATGSIQWEAWRPGAFQLHVETTQEAGLVISEGIAPGWTAKLDGAPVSLVPANVAVMAVVIPPGKHTLLVEYHAPGMRFGLVLSALGLIAALGLLRWRRGNASV